jgi:hypothetical protein
MWMDLSIRMKQLRKNGAGINMSKVCREALNAAVDSAEDKQVQHGMIEACVRLVLVGLINEDHGMIQDLSAITHNLNMEHIPGAIGCSLPTDKPGMEERLSNLLSLLCGKGQ